MTNTDTPQPFLARVRRRFAGNGLAKGASYLTIVQIVRLLALLVSGSIVLRHFGPAVFGLIAIAQAVFEGMLNLQVQVGHAVQTFVPQQLAANKPASVRLVLWAGYILRAASFGFLGLILITASHWVGKFYGSPELTLLTIILGLNALTRSLAGPIDINALFGTGRYRSIVYLNLLEILGTLCAAVAAWFFNLSAAGYLWAMLAALLPGYFYGWLLYPAMAKTLRWRGAGADESLRYWIGKVFRFGVPLSGAAFLYQSSLQAGILVAGRFFPPEVLGLFGFAVNTVRRAWGIISYAETLLLPHFAKAHAIGRAELRKAVRSYGTVMFGAALSAALGLVLFAHEATIVLAGPKFLDAVPLLQIFSFQFLFRGYEYLRFAIYAEHNSKRQLYITVLKIVSEILLIVLLFPTFGLWGLAAAHVLSFAVFSGLTVWYASKIVAEPERVVSVWGFQLKTCALGVVTLLGGVGLAQAAERLPLFLSYGVRGAVTLGMLSGLFLFVRAIQRRQSVVG